MPHSWHIGFLIFDFVLGSRMKSKKPSVYVDGMREYGEGWGSSQTGVNFIKACNHMDDVIEQARCDYYFNLINENDCDQRKLFKTASALLGGSSQEKYKRLPSFAQSWIESTH